MSVAAGRLLLLCERGGFAPLHQAGSVAAAQLAMGGRCDLVLFHAALARLLEERVDELEPGLDAREAYGDALASGRVRPVSQTLAAAREAGLRLFACSASVALLGAGPDAVLDRVDEVVGWPTILGWMSAADRVLYL